MPSSLHTVVPSILYLTVEIDESRSLAATAMSTAVHGEPLVTPRVHSDGGVVSLTQGGSSLVALLPATSVTSTPTTWGPTGAPCNSTHSSGWSIALCPA